MVDYNVNVLGGLDLGSATRRMFSDIESREQKQAAMQERDEFKRLAELASKGDSDALGRMFGINPGLAFQLEQREAQKRQEMGVQKAEQSKEAETSWGLRWRQASTPEEFESLKQEALSNPLIDFDESDLGVSGDQANLAVNAMLYRNLGKDAYREFFGAQGQEKGTYQVKDTPSGFIRINTATGELKEYPLDSKVAEVELEKRKEKLNSELKAQETIFDRARKLRDEYSDKTKEFQKVDDAFSRVKASTEDPDAAGDIALIFNYMKMLDPGSVVREGEFATAQNAGSVNETVYNMYNKLLSGERLNPNQRKMFESRAAKLFSAAKNKADRQKQDILGLGKRYNLTEQDIFGEEVQQQPQMQAPPQAIEYLKANPQLKDQFRAKYGYLPEGI